MKLEEQSIAFSCLLSSAELFTRCQNILKDSYFDPSLRQGIAFAQEYFTKYRAVPTTELVKAKAGLTIDTVSDITKDIENWAADELENFCRNKAVEEAILSAPMYLEKGDFEKIIQNLKNAIAVGLTKDLGIDYFDDPAARLRRLLEHPNVIPTGWLELDQALEGGIGRQQLLQFMANSGVGKSVILLNLALNLMKQKLNGIFISLEMSEDDVAQRADSMLTGLHKKEVMAEIETAAIKIGSKSEKYGKLHIKRMPESTTTANMVRAYIVEYVQANRCNPDFVIIDYLDLMTTNQKIAMDNLFVKDKYVAEEVRALGAEFDCIIASASQMGRAALEANSINQGHIQGGISKVNTVDNLIALIQTDAMKAAGEFVMELIKTRNSGGKGKQVMLRWSAKTLRVTDNVDSSGKLVLNKKKYPSAITSDVPSVDLTKSREKKEEPSNILHLMRT